MLTRLRVPILFSALLLLTAFVSAETIRFDPPNPTASRSVDAIVIGVWPNACLPLVKSVVITPTTITLHFDANVPLGVLCAQSTGPYSRTFHMGIVPPGGYTVILVADARTTSTELGRAPLIVRDAETLNVKPYAVPASGGEIVIDNPFFLAGATITIGGVMVPASSDVDGILVAQAPPHAPGAVDVIVNSTSGTVSAKAGLIYYDPAAADPAVFEPILFPLSFQGPGAFGSQWTTESFVLAEGSVAYFRDPLPCAACSTKLSANAQLSNNSNPWGHVLYAMRGTTGTADFASRIRDTSRAAQTAGTEVPIVHERDFRGQLRFPNIPVDSRFRTTLRLWSLGDFPEFHALVYPGSNLVAPLYVTRIPGTSMYFGSADLTSLLPQAKTTPVSVTVFPSGFPGTLSSVLQPPIWGMLSITNNDTQQVTIVSPQ
jgi:hypothetical protein